jgi:hypothetical protein
MHFILGCEKIKIHTYLNSGYVHLPGQTKRYILPFRFNGEENNQNTCVKNLHVCQCIYFISLTELFSSLYTIILFILIHIWTHLSAVLGSEKGKVMKWTVGNMQQRTEVEHMGWIFVFWGLHYEETLIAFRGINFTVNFGVNFGDSCMRSMQCNVEFGYQFSVCSKIKLKYIERSSSHCAVNTLPLV